MDKETLSNYGWIVICTLVLVVMIALSTPFGSYVGSAIKNTTESLFSSSASAMDTVLTEMGAEPVGRPDGIKFETANGTVGGTGSGSGSGTTGGGSEETPTPTPTPTTTGETWVINEDFFTTSEINVHIPFSSNGNQYDNFCYNIESPGEVMPYPYRKILTYSDNLVWCVDTSWADQTYRTITLDEPATGDFLTWLQANAVKQ